MPIVVGVSVGNPVGAAGAQAIRAHVTEEIASLRSRYPSTPLRLIVRPGFEARGVESDVDGVAKFAAAPDLPAPEALAAFILDTPVHRVIHVATTPLDRAALAVALLARRREGAVERVNLDPDENVALTVVTLAGTGNGHRVERTELAAILGAGDAKSQGAADRIAGAIERFNSERSADPPRGSAPAEDGIGECYARADALASHAQRRLKAAFVTIFALSTLAALFYGIFLVVRPAEVVLAPYVACLAIAYAVFAVARHERIHRRFVDYRTLAEVLRVQMHWNACGVRDLAAERFLAQRHGELDWVRSAARAVSWPGWGAPVQVTHDALGEWIDDQGGYFRRKLRLSTRSLGRYRAAVRITFAIGMAAAVVLMLRTHLPAAEPYLPALRLASVVCPILAATLFGFVNKMGYAYETKHYGNMAAILARAGAHRAALGPDATGAIARAFGEEALAEIGNWALFRHERAIEPPASPFKRPW